ncbi:acetyltransferase [Hoeflea sp. IMCC20628]|uniref:GNAT family N-acetyltransferase n=1 Tax=Hoeflea sp. IMCC20628 TaxID=1620421 RepID=UPI00063AABB8|nr:GNAT family N-acetyltransferase [Hoeflea sp. IMCC20628]AKI02542.1 acetyltransferase [Hoeflea sp. IMCC20628]
MIREFESRDTDAVVAIWRKASELAHPFLTGEFLDTEADALRNVYLAHAKTQVLEMDGRVVGFIAMAGNEVAGLFLDPAYHRRGLGKALVDKIASEEGTLTVDVFKHNAIGRRFYDGYGFQPVGEYVHEASGQVTLRMKLEG